MNQRAFVTIFNKHENLTQKKYNNDLIKENKADRKTITIMQ